MKNLEIMETVLTTAEGARAIKSKEVKAFGAEAATQIYAKVSDKKISDDTQNLFRKFKN